MGPPDEEMTDYVPEEEDGLGNVDGEEAVEGGKMWTRHRLHRY